MLLIQAKTADDAWRQSLATLGNDGLQQGSRDGETRELIHAALEVADPRQRIVFARGTNPAFAIAEVISILAGFNDVSFLASWNSRMKQFADGESQCFHGAYGFRLGSRPEIGERAKKLRHANAPAPTDKDQLRKIVDALQEMPDSRQAVLQYWNADSDLPNPKPVSKDVPCNLISHLMIRNEKLEWLQVMRSNDIIWGLPYNLVQFTSLQEIIAGWIGVEVGKYNHVSDSLHIYKRHFGYLTATLPTKAIPVNKTDLRIGPYEKWQETFREVIELTLNIMEAEKEKQLIDLVVQSRNLHPGYCEWMCILVAERLHKLGFKQSIDGVLAEAREYWSFAWRNRRERAKIEKEIEKSNVNS